MKIKKEEDKFVVFKNNTITELMGLSQEFADKFMWLVKRYNDFVPKPNKYIVCNQDEPYAEEVWNAILQGETRKHLHQLDDGFYWLISEQNERTLCKLYTFTGELDEMNDSGGGVSTITRTRRGFGFGTWDGGGFIELKDVLPGVKIIKADINEV